MICPKCNQDIDDISSHIIEHMRIQDVYPKTRTTLQSKQDSTMEEEEGESKKKEIQGTKRGRPKGSKNKGITSDNISKNRSKILHGNDGNERKRRGRPIGSKNRPKEDYTFRSKEKETNQEVMSDGSWIETRYCNFSCKKNTSHRVNKTSSICRVCLDWEGVPSE